ncbi:MAG TPA: hypothetical protein VKU19_00755 [Bryobacteraceae bacterium]|nr:hypothetical protein [Bryobacteraceae bacterium]
MVPLAYSVVLSIALGSAPAQVLTTRQTQLLEETRRVSLNYSKWLPDLICTELIHRDIDWHANGNWTAMDNLTLQVTYFDRRESYQLTARNQHATKQRIESLNGAISKGEFGSMLRWIFDPLAKASFEWQGAESIRRKAVSVFTYRVAAHNSRLELAAASHSIFAGFHGMVYVDDETNLVMRVIAEIECPDDFPIADPFVSIDYDWSEIAGHRYLVPVRAETRMTERAPDPEIQGGTKYRNRIQFRSFRKFTADSKLQWSGAEPSRL